MAKILIIDDAKFARVVMSKALNNNYYEVVEAENGEVGVQLANTENPDLILCDLLMPVMDGYGVLRELKQKGNFIKPIVMLSADFDSASKDKCLRLGADHFLTKPPVMEDLLGLVAECV
jgi:CheY-like chemotaxis protein